MSPFCEALERICIGPDYLAQKLKEELEATEIKAVVPKGMEEFVYSDPLIAWDVRQKARMDANRLFGDYPAEEHNHNLAGEIIVMKPERIRKPKNSGKANG